jgi:Zn-dependent protease
MFMWLGFINIALAMFNMILGFPLDGECVLRAVVGWITGDATVLLAEQVSSCWHFAFLYWRGTSGVVDCLHRLVPAGCGALKRRTG